MADSWSTDKRVAFSPAEGGESAPDFIDINLEPSYATRNDVFVKDAAPELMTKVNFCS
jgi:hypothetical protein